MTDWLIVPGPILFFFCSASDDRGRQIGLIFAKVPVLKGIRGWLSSINHILNRRATAKGSNRNISLRNLLVIHLFPVNSATWQ